MRIYYAEIYFEDKQTFMSFAIVSRNKKAARESALAEINKTSFRNRVIRHEFWTSKKVQGFWGTTVVSTIV